MDCAIAVERSGVIGFALERPILAQFKEGSVMPRYFFHLSFGDRTWPDDEGIELPGRAAARTEAAAIVDDLSHRGTDESPRRWAGWFLCVADAAGQFLSLEMGHPALALVPDQLRSEAATTGRGRIVELARRALQLRQYTESLLEENQQLRQELASEFTRSQRVRLRARELLSGTRGARLQSIGVADLHNASAPPRRSRPHLVLLPGGVRK